MRSPPPLRPPSEAPVRPKLSADDERLIAEAVAAGKVRRVEAIDAALQRRAEGSEDEAPKVPQPWPDEPDHVRRAALYLQSRGVTVVKISPDKFLLDARWSVKVSELLDRANAKRAKQKLPPIVAPKVSA